MKANRTTRNFARIEMLESRRLLSAATISVIAPATATRAAVHTHPTVPNILGTFNGTYAATNGTSGDVIITITSEGKGGKLAGTLTVVGTGTLQISGSVNVKGKLSLHGSIHHLVITLTGAVSNANNTLSGKFHSTSNHGSAHGTFTTTKAAVI